MAGQDWDCSSAEVCGTLYVLSRTDSLEISEIMGGRIEVKSQLGAGSSEPPPLWRLVCADGTAFRFFVQTSKTAPIEQAASPERRRSSTVTLDLRPGIHTAVTSLRLEDGQGQADGEAVAAHVDGAANGLNQAVKDGADLGKLRILIVEDNLINQTVLQRQLTKTGWLSDGAFLPEPIQLLLRRADRSRQ